LYVWNQNGFPGSLSALALQISTGFGILLGLYALMVYFKSDKKYPQKFLGLICLYLIMIGAGYYIQSTYFNVACIGIFWIIFDGLPRLKDRQEKYGLDPGKALENVAAKLIGAEPSVVFSGFHTSIIDEFTYQYLVAEAGKICGSGR
jgi:hypothetical protein